jgi:hypothetical protein
MKNPLLLVGRVVIYLILVAPSLKPSLLVDSRSKTYIFLAERISQVATSRCLKMEDDINVEIEAFCSMV